MPRVLMNRARALLVCTRPADYWTWRVRESAEHLLAQPNVSEEEKRLASDVLEISGGHNRDGEAGPAADTGAPRTDRPHRPLRRKESAP
jgi:hypothetical protein